MKSIEIENGEPATDSRSVADSKRSAITLALANIVASLSPRGIPAIVEFRAFTFATVDFTRFCGRIAAMVGKPHDAFRCSMTMTRRSAPSLPPRLR